MVMQSQGGIELVAELPQSPKNGYRVVDGCPPRPIAHSRIVGVSPRGRQQRS